MLQVQNRLLEIHYKQVKTASTKMFNNSKESSKNKIRLAKIHVTGYATTKEKQSICTWVLNSVLFALNQVQLCKINLKEFNDSASHSVQPFL